MNKDHKILQSVHGYAGDRQQIIDLMPVYEHHKIPIVIMGCEDSPIERMGVHICRNVGARSYIGQLSWDRQYQQLKTLLEYPFDWILMNDSDSFCLTPELPEYLFERQDVVYANVVDDFRVPGETWTDGRQDPVTWPKDYHQGFPLIAMQPPYFMSRYALELLVKHGEGAQACPITPFIDWWFPHVCTLAGLRYERFHNCASCETSTANGLAVMSNCVNEGATFIHSVKDARVRKIMVDLHRKRSR